MLSSVLIANRGEIAVRVARTARRLGMKVIAVASEADAQALHVRMADEVHLIGPAAARDSYLVIDKIIAAAKASSAACIHPGYGFLSERAEFADACAEAGIVFVGPPASAIRAMGLKDGAKALMEIAKVPVVPGYHGANQDAEFLRQRADEIGYPVLIKAVAGGGGKGMRKVERSADFADALASAQREGASSFGDPRVLIEKYIESPRHVEIQVFADGHGNAVYLGERDCSLQRRHQKVIEEAPAPGMTAEVRAAMGRAAVEAAKAVGYVGAGTVEFIADGRNGLKPDGFWFMEMNTRLQVEHPVTEAITGLDLVELQFRVAAGEKLPLTQDQVQLTGHAVEARLYAEDPEHGFLPSSGRLLRLALPEGMDGIRIDSGVIEGGEVTPHYDPMIAKVIAHGATRDEALDRLGAALEQTVVAGPRSNTAFLAALAGHEAFRSGAFDTGFIDRHLDGLIARDAASEAAAVAAAAQSLILAQRPMTPVRADGWVDPFAAADGFTLGAPRRAALSVNVDGEARPFEVSFDAAGPVVTVEGSGAASAISLTPGRAGVHVVFGGRQRVVALPNWDGLDLDHLDGGGAVSAPMHGKVLAVFVAAGDRVEKGQRLAILEAMKMEHALVAPSAGTVSEVAAEAGQQVGEGARLITITADEAA